GEIQRDWPTFLPAPRGPAPDPGSGASRYGCLRRRPRGRTRRSGGRRRWSRRRPVWAEAMTARSRKRRSPGEGGCWPDPTRAGGRSRGRVLMPDGTTEMVGKKGFLTKKAGLAWLAEAQSAGRRGEYVEPSKEKLGTYGREVIGGLRIGPQTRASYLKNWRLHIQPHPVAPLPLAQLTGTKLTAHYRALEKSGRKDHREGEGLSPRTVRYMHTT